MRHAYISLFLIFMTVTIAANAQVPETNLQQKWHLLEARRFGIFATLQRTQGLTTDGKGNFWFSNNWGLARSQGVFGISLRANIAAIPEHLKRLGDNHIGDIDYAWGRIYAPIEDGHWYHRPHVAVFDANTLEYLSDFPLVYQDQPDGVPWVAVQSDRELAYSSNYGDCAAINIYDLVTFKLLGRLPLSQIIHSVQGAKVYGDQMFLTSNRDKSVYQLDLTTGQVEKLFKVPDDVHEIEGLAIVPETSGIKLYVLALSRPHSVFSIRSEVLVYGLSN